MNVKTGVTCTLKRNIMTHLTAGRAQSGTVGDQRENLSYLDVSGGEGRMRACHTQTSLFVYRD